jgi:hypothetical protein
MEYHEMQQRLDEIQGKLIAARDEAEAGLELINKLTIELLRERATRKEERDGGSDPIQH